MRSRLLTAATTATVLAATLSGCITVHGETAVVPAISTSEARKVLDRFIEVNNKANRTFDAELNKTIEGGALGAIDQAGLRARDEVHRQGNEDFSPLELTDPRFLIPEQAGWPKSFVADTASNRGNGSRWYLVFQRDGIDEPWLATYLAVLSEEETPEFATDGDGHVQDVPVGGGPGGEPGAEKLAVPPEKASKSYTTYLQEGGEGWAAGPHTSAWREERAKNAEQPRVRTEWADLPVQPPRFTPFALRTEDGGAVVFFASEHYMKQTASKGYSPKVDDPYVEALMEGEAKQSVTYVRVSEQAVLVPTAADGGDVEFLSRVTGLTEVKGS
ncbi:hypothetical protein E4198_20170 [Streptomyces sp. RKND-216]|uniref:hypothetical protein n=1 Tax=Streptomyces sp. RKND-216 TaxID=2562581 RepID=UPI00109DFC05|nr:hypothetical protein [Streptomyces sp. RKND-216]THA26672.1 hypothetical protein E4198_20170 [Streptomyces sp. RKND-216]